TARPEVIDLLHRAEFERARLLEKAPHPLRQALQKLLRRHAGVRQILRSWHLRRADLVFETVLLDLEGGGHVENLLAVLNRHHAAVGKTMTVETAIDLVDDRSVEVTTAHE